MDRIQRKHEIWVLTFKTIYDGSPNLQFTYLYHTYITRSFHGIANYIEHTYQVGEAGCISLLALTII